MSTVQLDVTLPGILGARNEKLAFESPFTLYNVVCFPFTALYNFLNIAHSIKTCPHNLKATKDRYDVEREKQ